MASISGIYEIRNTANGHKYIGSAINIKRRWIFHIYCLNKNNHHNAHLQRAWNKYGESSFVFSILEMCDKSFLVEREQFYIDTTCPEYNIFPTARSGLGYRHTEEAKMKMSISCRQRPAMRQETKDKLSRINTGKNHPHTQETKDKISASKKGICTTIFDQETRDKLSRSTTAYWKRKKANGS